MRLIISILFFTLIFTLASCFTSRQIKAENFHLYEIPAGQIKLSDNFFYDQAEVTNFNWLEYMFWTSKIYGDKSEEYEAVLPDTSVWLKLDSCLHKLTDSYLRHPAYRDYPVVGITKEQATNYAKWRSDRVFEYLLEKYDVIEWDTAQNKNTYFTIEKFFNGELTNVISDEEIEFYPSYKLPTFEQRKMVLRLSDSIDKVNCPKYNTRKCAYLSSNYPELRSNIKPCANDSFIMAPTRYIIPKGCSKNVNTFYNLRGNVSEWISDESFPVGGSWIDNYEDIYYAETVDFPIDLNDSLFKKLASLKLSQKEREELKSANPWTGLRNVCRWEKWEGK